MNDKIFMFVMIAVIVFVCVIFLIVLPINIYLYYKHHPCIQYGDVCKEAYMHLQPMPMGKSITLIPMTNYRTVECSKHHDTVVRECIKRI
jgi:hypothetical protein